MSQSASLKKISDQVIVITGAASGIGLATSLLAAEQGARVVLSARSENELRDIVCQIRQKNGEAIFVEADVSKIEDVDRIAERALSEFGRIDSWINNESISLFGELTEVSLEEKRHLFEVNFWGAVYGCRAAVKAMSKTGGVIVNTVPSPSKLIGMDNVIAHAIRAYTDALRLELSGDQIPIFVSLAVVEDGINEKTILSWCESTQGTSLIGTIRKFYPGKSAAVAAGLGVAAYAAFKAIQHARKPGEITH